MASKPTKASPEQVLPSDRKIFRETAKKWKANLGDDPSERVELLRIALEARDQLFAQIRADYADDFADEIALFGNNDADLVIRYLEFKRMSVDLAQGLQALLIDYASERTPEEVKSELAIKASRQKLQNDPRHQAMLNIRREFERWRVNEVAYKNDAEFAKRMIQKCPELANEGSIKNACTRWRRLEQSSS